MDSILNLDEPPLTPEEIEEVKQNARERLRLWKRRALYAAEAFVLSCGLVYPISKGAPLHAYAHVFGIFLVALAEAFFLVLVYCTGLLWAAWKCLRDLEKGEF